MKPTRKCSIDGCGDTATKRGWCNRHYLRWWRHGDPLGGRDRFKTPEEAFTARTEWRGACLIWTGSKHPAGYGQIQVSGKLESSHRYAWRRAHGPIPEGMEVDHFLHCDPSCVNVKHLRLATTAQNLYHKSGARADSGTGVRNVFRRPSGSYYAQVRKGGNAYYLGTYSSLEEAANVAEQKRKELFGEFAGKG